MTAATSTAPAAWVRPGSNEPCARRSPAAAGQRPCLRIVRKLFTALTDPAGVLAHRPGAFERIAWVIDDWDHARTKLVETEARMVAVLDELGLTELACSIDGLSPVGAAAILAETGDLTRFTSARAVVKHAGLAPRERMSGTFTGKARLSGAGRPRAARRRLASRVGMPANQPGVRRPLPAPDHPRDQQAQAHPGTDRRRRRDPAPAPLRRSPTARPGTPPSPPTAPEHWRWLRHNPIRRQPRQVGSTPRAGAGRAFRGIENHQVSRRTSQAAPSRRRHNPITRCRAHLDYRYAGTDDGHGHPPTP